MQEPLDQLASWLRDSRFTVVLTGAGMSTESGIPDFRSQSGWWKDIDPRTVATVEALDDHYDLFHEFYTTRLEGLRDCKPHRGHYVLAEWEAGGRLQHIATQNVDGFHQEAGNRSVSELHGSLHRFRCHNCDSKASGDDFFAKKPCERCGGKLRPDVVLFGETLPQDAWRQALGMIQQAELVLVIGTSLQVYPVSQLPMMTDGKVAILNYEATDYDRHFDLVLHGKAGELLQRVSERI